MVNLSLALRRNEKFHSRTRTPTPTQLSNSPCLDSVRQVPSQPCALCRLGGLRVRAPARRTRVRLRGAVLRNPPQSASVCPAVGGGTCRAWHCRHRSKPVSGARRSHPLIRRALPRRSSSSRVAWRCRFAVSLCSPASLLAMLAPCRARREPRPARSLCSLLASSPRLFA